MTDFIKPDVRPAEPCFSSGPCTKRPGWTPAALSDAFIGRSHRHKDGKAKILEVLDRTRAILGVPDDYRIGIIPASDTGAMEAALWSMMGARGADMLAWESFGTSWAGDVVGQLKLSDVRVLKAGYGELPDLGEVEFDRDVVFTWNGTTSGVCVPDGDWIADDRDGLTICDATSAAFAVDLPWRKLDVTTYSWQKVMGGEAAHGMMIVSPRAIERLETYVPPWPLPKIFRLTKGGKFFDEPFTGVTINTPSMLCVEDAIDGLSWAEKIGGLTALQARNQANFAALDYWVASSNWIAFLAVEPSFRSTTSVTLKIVDPWLETAGAELQASIGNRLAAILEDEGVAYDLAAHRNAPPGLRIWAGATVEASDLEALGPWLDWAFACVKAEVRTDG